jgi:hypothetical protein
MIWSQRSVQEKFPRQIWRDDRGIFCVDERGNKFAKLLHIGHPIVTWMLESAAVNVSAPCPGSRKTAVLNANGSEGSAPASVGDRTDAGCDASQRDFAMGALAGTQRARLINASCKAFFIKRGLDPEVDWHTPLPLL